VALPFEGIDHYRRFCHGSKCRPIRRVRLVSLRSRDT
jgi:hypothetical protein